MDNVYLLIFYGVVLLLVLVASFLLFYIRNQSVVWKQKRQLQETQLAQQKELLSAVIDSQEMERKRIGQDLHDEIGGTLSAIKLMLNALKRQIPDEHTESLTDAKELIDKMIVDVRHISHDLSPPGLSVFGLFRTVDAFVTLINNTGQIKITLLHVGDVEALQLPEKTALALFRVLTQLVDNTIKHAKATAIDISFQLDEKLLIRYNDNGTGFDLDVLKRSAGIGMQNIRSRLQMINAEYQIITAPGKGFSVSIELDYDQQSVNLN
jgi:signal transduction histidine kinase